MYMLTWVYAYNPMHMIKLRYRTFPSPPEFHVVPLPSQLYPRSAPAATVLISFTGLELLIHWIMIMDFFVWLHPAGCEIHVRVHSRCMRCAVKCNLLYFAQIVPCMNVPQFIFPLFCWKLFGFFPVWGYYGLGCSKHSCTSLFVDLCFHFSWVRT